MHPYYIDLASECLLQMFLQLQPAERVYWHIHTNINVAAIDLLATGDRTEDTQALYVEVCL